MAQKFHKVVERKRKTDKGKSEVSSKVGYRYGHGWRVLSATDLMGPEGPRPFTFKYDKDARMTQQAWTYADGTLGQVKFVQYNPDGSVVATEYYPKDGELLLYPSGVEISIAQIEDQAKVYRVKEGDYVARLNYAVAQRLNLPELFGRDVMKQDAFTFFEAYSWLNEDSPIKPRENHPALQKEMRVGDYQDWLQVSIPTHRPLDDIVQ